MGAGSRIVLDVSDWDLRDGVECAGDAMIGGLSPEEPEMLRRGGALVRVQRDDDGHGVVRRVVAGSLAKLVAEWVQVVRVSASGKARGTSPPQALVNSLLAELPGDIRVPSLRGLIRHPFLARGADGFEMVWADGYHRRSGWWLDCVEQLDGGMGVGACRDAWFDLMGEFPCAAKWDESALLAGALSAVCKPAAGLTPVVVVHKPSVGTGATLACRVVGRVLTGQDPTLLTPTGGGRDDEAEMRKRLFSLLRAGRGMVVLDNFESLESDVLASVATAGVVEDRVMGGMDVERMEVGAVIWATGNNLLTSADIASRALPVRLDADMPDPSSRRGFRHDPIADVALEFRAHWLSALVSMVARWVEAGCPGPPTGWQVSRFSGWHETVAGVVAFVLGSDGELDPMGGRKRFMDLAVADDWSAFVAAVLALGRSPVYRYSTGELMEVMEAMSEPPWDAGRATTERGKKVSLGKALKKLDRRQFAMGDGRIYQFRRFEGEGGRTFYGLPDTSEPAPWEDGDGVSVQEGMEF